MSTEAIAAFLLGVVVAIWLRALPRLLHRPLVELIVGEPYRAFAVVLAKLYAAAQRAYSAATAADSGLVAYRIAMRQAKSGTVRAYLATHAPGAGLEALDSLGSGRAGNGEPVGDRESEGAAVASGCPTMEVA